MHARVTRFEERDASLTDELIQRARERGPTSIPDARGFLGLFDRERGTRSALRSSTAADSRPRPSTRSSAAGWRHTG
jgi:hypothetical protein